jgi:hypothetical protein
LLAHATLVALYATLLAELLSAADAHDTSRRRATLCSASKEAA